ncbi:MAG: hypothetical protein NTV34_01795 [Proteobacteria bacterium]|nr:hypothetical protein [Pseudomonadota bacterium]
MSFPTGVLDAMKICFMNAGRLVLLISGTCVGFVNGLVFDYGIAAGLFRH